MTGRELWQRFKKYFWCDDGLGMQLDISHMMFDEGFFDRMESPMKAAFAAMVDLELGGLANTDERRMVGHYWLRAPNLAPTPEIRTAIESTTKDVRDFAEGVHSERIIAPGGEEFYIVLLIGIGGSALGSQFVCDALGSANDAMLLRFIDNTDPDGIDRVLDELEESLGQTLVIVVSKSGETEETRNGMIEVADAFRRAGIAFNRQAVAVTCEGSKLHQQAKTEQWLKVFPLWDWVGGRTSVTSAAGLLPLALQGLDVKCFLEGASQCDIATRTSKTRENPAALLALMWYYAQEGHGRRNMVVLPYRDRLGLFGKYLQQLVMESLGKAIDRAGRTVHQGLTVFGNKGTTDQHSYIQQLSEGLIDFFVTFVDVKNKRNRPSPLVGDGVFSGDYLNAFLEGTRGALFGNGRESITITLDSLDARSVGALIALFERAVGLYAELINVNAYHQPGVQAGKKAAAGLLAIQKRILDHLTDHAGESFTAETLADALGKTEHVHSVFRLLEHLSSNPDHGVVAQTAGTPERQTFGIPV